MKNVISFFFFLMTIVLSVLLWFTDSDYLPLVSSNSSYVIFGFQIYHDTLKVMTYEHKNQKELKPMANQTETDKTNTGIKK